MNLKASIVIMSHLSDAQEEMNHPERFNVNHRINFVKFLILKYPDTNTEINPDADYVEFMEKHSSKTHMQKNNIEPLKHNNG